MEGNIHNQHFFAFHFLYLTIYPSNHSISVIILSFTDEKTGLKRLNNLPKITYLVRRNKAGFEPKRL